MVCEEVLTCCIHSLLKELTAIPLVFLTNEKVNRSTVISEKKNTSVSLKIHYKPNLLHTLSTHERQQLNSPPTLTEVKSLVNVM